VIVFRRAALPGVVALSVVLALSGCRAATPLTESAVRAGTPGEVAGGVSLSVESMSCSPASAEQLCSLRVWYANATQSDLRIDASRLLIRDSSGGYRTGTVDGSASSLSIQAQGRALVLWGVVLPADVHPVSVVWSADSGGLVVADVGGASATSSGSPSPTASLTPSASGSPAPTSAPTPTPTRTPTATPKPTRTARPTPTARPTARPRPSASATTPIGSIG
jgi:hypothetical protein